MRQHAILCSDMDVNDENSALVQGKIIFPSYKYAHSGSGRHPEVLTHVNTFHNPSFLFSLIFSAHCKP